MGVAPSSLVVLPINMVNTSNVPAANIMDHIPMVNIMPFGMCQSLANPMVATATVGGDGRADADALHPDDAWRPGRPGSPTVMLGPPALAQQEFAMLMCNWAGQISVAYEGQATHAIP